MLPEATIELLTAATFDAKVAANTHLAIDFWAEWCQPCRTFDAVLEEVAAEGESAFTFARVDIAADPELAARFAIQSVPALVLLREGEPVRKLFGAKPKRQVLETLARYAD